MLTHVEFGNRRFINVPSTMNVQTVIQTLTGLITLGYSLVRLSGDIKNILHPPVPPAPSPDVAVSPDPPKAVAKRNLLDLSLSLLLAAFFSLLLLDALVVSGRDIIRLDYSVWLTLLITIILSVSFLFSWLRGKLEQTIGVYSILVFFILIFSPGGPFFIKESAEAAAAINLWIPVFALLLLASTMLVYAYGNPFDKRQPLLKRQIISALLVILFLCGSLSIGLQLKKDVLQDSSSLPSINTDTTKRIITSIRNENVTEQRQWFKLFSESDLQSDYRDNFSKVYSELTSTDTSDTQPKNLALVQRYDGSFIPQQLSQPNNNSSVAQQRREILDRLFGFFTTLSTLQKQTYLAERLKLLYPIGSKAHQRPVLDVPGNNSFQRLNGLEDVRLACFDKISFSSKNTILGLFYDDDLRTVKKEDYYNRATDYSTTTTDDATTYVPGRRKYRGIRRLLEVDREKLVDPIISEKYFARLNEQMFLPTSYEMYVAYREYLDLDSALLVEKFKEDSLKRSNVSVIIESLHRLPSDEYSSFEHYILTDSNKLEAYATIMSNVDSFEYYITPLVETHNNPDNLLANIIITAETKKETAIDSLGQGRAVSWIRGLQKNQPLYEKTATLLSTQDAFFPVSYLFRKDVLNILRLTRQFRDKERDSMFYSLQHPIDFCLNSLLQTGITLTSTRTGLFDTVAALSNKEKENVVSRCAMEVFNNAGEFSPPLVDIMIYNVDFISAFWGLLLSTLLCAPYVFISLFLGSLLARRLIVRDNLRQIVMSEEKYSYENEFSRGEIPIQGRNKELNKMVDLAGRGWSAIAIVGRRGIGKTRILSELYHNSLKKKSNLSAWISAPTQYTEEEFIQNAFEQIINNVENRISETIGSQPYEVRRLENRSVFYSINIFLIFFIVTVLVFSLMTSGERFSNPQVLTSWFPIGMLLAGSMGMLVYKAITLQPIDLSSWLERDKANNPYCALLYRDTIKAKTFLNNRELKSKNVSFFKKRAIVILTGVIGLCLINFLYLVIFSPRLSDRVQVTFNLLLLNTICIVFIGYLYKRAKEANVFVATSLMSLITHYRTYLERVVAGIRKGALGSFDKSKLEVIICIDELDKIEKKEQLRDFIRRIKILFEIPGVYYYLSLSQDAFNAMYLGIALGKDEIDSSFDHIVNIPSLGLSDCKELAFSYLKANSSLAEEILQSAAIGLVLISFGIPRDILRRCDEFLSDSAKDTDKLIVTFRDKLATLAYKDQVISLEKLQFFRGDALSILNVFSTYDFGSGNEEKVVSTLFLLSFAHYLFSVSQLQSKEELYTRILQIGYEIGGDNVLIEVTKKELQSLISDLLSHMQSATE